MPVLGKRLKGPSTLSSRATSWSLSGFRCTSFLPSLRPIFWKMRVSADISNGLKGGPTDCEASEEFGRLTRTFCGGSVESGDLSTKALGSREPKGLTPLKSFLARPSQKLRKLNTALTLVGVLRGSVRRTVVPPTFQIESGRNVTCSCALPRMMSMKFDRKTPCEPVMSLLSKSTAELRSSGLAKRWKG